MISDTSPARCCLWEECSPQVCAVFWSLGFYMQWCTQMFPQITTTDTWWSQSARNLVTCSRLPHRPQLVSQSAASQTFFALRVTMGQNNNNGVFMKPCQALLITAHPQSKPSAPVRNIRQALIKAAVKQREAVVCLRLSCSFCSHLSTKTQLLASSLQCD